MTADIEARRRMVLVIRDWLEGNLSTSDFVLRYWGTRNQLLEEAAGAFIGPFGQIMGDMDGAVHVYSPDLDRADWEIDEERLKQEAQAVLDRLREAHLSD